MRRIFKLILIGAAGAALLAGRDGHAQALFTNWTNAGTGSWTTASNWSGGLFGPAVPSTDESDVARINNGGTATVSSAVSETPGGLSLGSLDTTSGTVTIQSGGSLSIIKDAGLPQTTGIVTVGAVSTGRGNLNVLPGGSLTALSLVSGGNTASSVTLGATTGAGATTINVELATFGRQTRVIGSNVNFTASNSLEFLNTGRLTAQITSPTTFSALKANNLAVMGGTLAIEFGAGITPAVGNSWNILDSRQVAGSFVLDTSAAPTLGPGQVYDVRTQNGGLGKQVQLTVEQRLLLTVNRTTGAVSITNPGASGISIDGYGIRSAGGNLNQAAWTPLGGGWQVANASATQLNQLNQSGNQAINAAGAIPLGNVFLPTPAAFGEEVADVTFEYTQPSGITKTGVVSFTGSMGINNLTLIVDPATGKGRLRNTSTFNDIRLDAYTISSTAGSLVPGQWSSLDDQNSAGGDWQEGNATTGRLSELKFGGFAALNSSQYLEIGNPFNEAGGARDLKFEFILSGESFIRTGAVVYETIPAGVPGDYSGDGVVDAADYTIWRDHRGQTFQLTNEGAGQTPGSVTIEDYTFWKSRFGATSGAGSELVVAANVPEPGTAWLAIGVLFIAANLGPRNRQN